LFLRRGTNRAPIIQRENSASKVGATNRTIGIDVKGIVEASLLPMRSAPLFSFSKGDFMSAYMITKINVTNWDRYREYTNASPGAVAKFGGRFIVRGGETITLEGPEETSRIVVLEFPSLEKAKEFYYSEEYQTAKRIREGAATVLSFAVAGI
jgi:uncharacterized protein (DUF1330 family)